LRSSAPLLHLKLFGNRLFRSTSVVIMIAMAALLGVLFVAPLFFQIALGLSALQSGLNTFPEAIGVMIGSQLASRVLYRRVGPRRLISGGLVWIAGCVALMSLIGLTTDLWWMRVLMLLMGLGMGHVIMSTQASSFATVSVADTGSASSLFNSGRQLGSALGVALLATVLAAVGTTKVEAGHHVTNVAAYHTAFLVGAVIALIGAGVAQTVVDSDAAATMVPAHSPQRPAARIDQNGQDDPAGATALDSVT
jgi:MFS family permease